MDVGGVKWRQSNVIHLILYSSSTPHTSDYVSGFVDLAGWEQGESRAASEERREESLSLNFGEIEKKGMWVYFCISKKKIEKRDFSSFIQESEQLLDSCICGFQLKIKKQKYTVTAWVIIIKVKTKKGWKEIDQCLWNEFTVLYMKIKLFYDRDEHKD